MSVACTIARMRLPSHGGDVLSGRLGEHVASCLVCQADQARYRTMQRWLGDLRYRTELAPLHLAPAVTATITRPVAAVSLPTLSPSMARTTVAAAAGAAVVAAAVIVGIRRSRAA
jgi:hypothetical protein